MDTPDTPRRVEHQLTDKGYVPVYTTAVVEQPWADYTATDHEVWATLFKRQREILSFLTAYSEEHGYAPSFEEIAEAFNYNSLATVHEHLSNLDRKGYIRKSFNESRAIEILPSEVFPRAPGPFVRAARDAAKAGPADRLSAIEGLGVAAPSLTWTVTS